MTTLSKFLSQHLLFTSNHSATRELKIEDSLASLRIELEEYKERDDLIADTVQECFAKVTQGARIQKLNMVVFAALCKKLPDTSGEETDMYLSHITEYLERNTGDDGIFLLGCKAGKGGGTFLWAHTTT